MKMSVVTGYIAQVIFWFNCILFGGWFFTQNNSPWILLLMTAILILVGFLSRSIKNKLFVFLTHLCMISIPGIFYAPGWMTGMIFVFAMGIIIISMITRYAESDFMDMANTFEKVVLVIMYLIGAIMGYKYSIVLFVTMFVYFFLEFIQINFQKNEEYADGLNYTSIGDIGKITSMANLMTLITSLIMAAICGIISLIGIIPPIAKLSEFMKDKANGFLSFLRRVELNTIEKETETIKPVIPGQSGENFENEALVGTQKDDIIMAVTIVIIGYIFIVTIYFGIKQLYRYYLKLQQMGLLDEEVSLNKDKAVKNKKINPRDLDASYSNRKALRRIYKRRIKGNKRGVREDLTNRTPYEQREKVITEGNSVSTEFVDLYERARYSNEAVTKDDVRRMNKIAKE